MQKGSSRKIEIHISGDFNAGGDIVGGDLIATGRIESSFNLIDKADISNELKVALKELSEAVRNLSMDLPNDIAQDLARHLGILISEATSKTPRREWWQLSTGRITKVAESVGEIGKPVLILASRLVTILSKQ